jgi:hypothetical protein
LLTQDHATVDTVIFFVCLKNAELVILQQTD